jgi:hypothetical protein
MRRESRCLILRDSYDCCSVTRQIHAFWAISHVLPAPARPLRRIYDYRLRELVIEAGASAVNDVALPRSTAATLKKQGHIAVVSSDCFVQRRRTQS